MIWRFQIYNLFREKFKFRGFTKVFTNLAKYIIAFIFAKFKYFAKQIIIFGISRSRASKWYIICSYSKSLKFFRTSENGLKSTYFAKIAHKIAKPKYFPNIFDDSDSPINSLSDDILICWGNLSLSKIIGGGGALRTAASFYSAKVCSIKSLMNLNQNCFCSLFHILMTKTNYDQLENFQKNWKENWKELGQPDRYFWS